MTSVEQKHLLSMGTRFYFPGDETDNGVWFDDSTLYFCGLRWMQLRYYASYSFPWCGDQAHGNV
jgi:hypothetical protein